MTADEITRMVNEMTPRRDNRMLKAYYVMIGAAVCHPATRDEHFNDALTVLDAYLEDYEKAYRSAYIVELKDALRRILLLEKSNRISIDKRTFNTILAALRYWQRDLPPGYIPDSGLEIARDGGVEELSVGEIDELCEAINIGDLYIGAP